VELIDDALTTRQLDLLRRMESFDPPVRLIGGYAEDALLAGSVTRPHVDIDWLFPRRELELRLAQAGELGFDELAVRGDSAPGHAFYLYGERDGLELEIGIVDEESGGLWMKIHSLAFEIDGRPAAAGYRIELPSDTFQHPPVQLEGIRVWPASPLALYQMRVGIAAQGSFGKPGEKQLRAMQALKERFFSDRSASELMPRVEPLLR
jgi:hypothetical protein